MTKSDVIAILNALATADDREEASRAAVRVISAYLRTIDDGDIADAFRRVAEA